MCHLMYYEENGTQRRCFLPSEVHKRIVSDVTPETFFIGLSVCLCVHSHT